MSPRLLLFAAAVLAAPAAHAQATFGIKAGLNVSDLTGSDAPRNTDPRLGFAGGVLANIPVGTSGAYVQPEVLYSMKGVTGSNGDGTLALDYVEVPLVLGFAAPVTDSGLLVGGYAGPALAFKVRESVDFDTDFGSGSIDSDVFKDTDVGGALGVTVGAGAFGIDGRYTFGLTNALDTDIDDDSARNGVFTIAATYRFGAPSTARTRRRGRRY